MQDFDKHIKSILENPPEFPVNEQVWKRVESKLHPYSFSPERLWWLLPLAMMPIAILSWLLTGSPANDRAPGTSPASIVISDTIYKKTIIHTYDTVYHHTVIVEEVHKSPGTAKPYTGSWQQTPPQGFGSLASFMRSGFRSLESFSRWSSLSRQKDVHWLTGTRPLQATPAVNTKEKSTIYVGLKSAAALKNKYFSAIFPNKRVLHASPMDLAAIQAAGQQSRRRAKLANAAYQVAGAIAPDAFGFGITTSAEMYLDGSMQGHVAHANGLSLYLDLNPRMRLVGGIELLSVNYDEFEPGRFSKYPHAEPPSSDKVLTRIEPYLTYYRLPLGMELRLHKRARVLEPYAQAGLFWIRKSEKSHLEYYFSTPQTGDEHILKVPIVEEAQSLSWLPGSWWAGAGLDWYPFPHHRNLLLRGQATYVQYTAGLEPKLNFTRSLGFRASLSYTLSFR